MYRRRGGAWSGAVCAQGSDSQSRAPGHDHDGGHNGCGGRGRAAALKVPEVRQMLQVPQVAQVPPVAGLGGRVPGLAPASALAAICGPAGAGLAAAAGLGQGDLLDR